MQLSASTPPLDSLISQLGANVGGEGCPILPDGVANGGDFAALLPGPIVAVGVGGKAPAAIVPAAGGATVAAEVSPVEVLPVCGTKPAGPTVARSATARVALAPRSARHVAANAAAEGRAVDDVNTHAPFFQAPVASAVLGTVPNDAVAAALVPVPLATFPEGDSPLAVGDEPAEGAEEQGLDEESEESLSRSGFAAIETQTVATGVIAPQSGGIPQRSLPAEQPGPRAEGENHPATQAVGPSDEQRVPRFALPVSAQDARSNLEAISAESSAQTRTPHAARAINTLGHQQPAPAHARVDVTPDFTPRASLADPAVFRMATTAAVSGPSSEIAEFVGIAVPATSPVSVGPNVSKHHQSGAASDVLAEPMVPMTPNAAVPAQLPMAGRSPETVRVADQPVQVGAPVRSVEVSLGAQAPESIETLELALSSAVAKQPTPIRAITHEAALARVPVRVEAKFAAGARDIADSSKSSEDALEKTFLNSERERFVSHLPELGTGVANSEPSMAAPSFTPLAKPEAVFARVASAHAPVAVVEHAPMVAEQPAVTTSIPATAERAVEAVLTAVERFGAGERHTVNLQFSVGGADLAVRVELRADEVRATFRTDSSELRTALAHEWQAVAADASERPFRLAPPVITTSQSDGSGLSAFVGDGASERRDGQTRRSAAEVFGSIATRSRGFISHAAAEITPPIARAALVPTSLHLHTLA